MIKGRIVQIIGLGVLLAAMRVNSVWAFATAQTSLQEPTAPLSAAADRSVPAPLKTTFEIRAESSIGHNQDLQQLIAKNEGRQVH